MSALVTERWLRVLGRVAIAANFLWFCAAAVHAHFAPDDMMNIGLAWETGIGEILTGILRFYADVHRSTGALYYWICYQFFGLNPVPYRILDLAVMALNIWLAYRLAVLLSGSRFVGWLCALLFSYHARIVIWEAYSGAFTYDRLCFTFSVLTLFVYARPRMRGDGITFRRGVVLAFLYLLALGAKEMAAVVPLLLIAYECIYALPEKQLRQSAWLTIAILGLMAALYAYGKTHGPEALSSLPGYHLNAPTIGNYLRAQGRYLQDYFFRNHALSVFWAASILAAMPAIALAFRSRPLLFALAFIWISPLPIAFTDRAFGCLYIPWLGWCLFAAAAVQRLSDRMPRFRRAVLAGGAVATFFLFLNGNLHTQKSFQPVVLHQGDVTWRMIEDLNRMHPAIPAGSKVLVRKSPFDAWDMRFIVELWAGVKPVEVLLAGKNVDADTVPAGMSLVLTLDPAGHLIAE